MTKRKRMICTGFCGITAAGLLLWASAAAVAQDTSAQEQPGARQVTRAELEASQGQPTQPQAGEVMGPPAPGGIKVTPAGGAAQPGAATRKPMGVPDPTVVLKPGEVPGIKFDTPDYDFGRIQAGPTAAHDFWFTNTGTGALEILKVAPG